MKIINLTPFDVTLGGVAYPSEGIARVKMATRTVEVPGLTVTAVSQSAAGFEGLPEPQEGVIIVVSAMVANAAERDDVCHPTVIRDDKGRIVGDTALAFPSR